VVRRAARAPRARPPARPAVARAGDGPLADVREGRHAALASRALPSIEESQTGALGTLVPNSADALDAELRSSELFGVPLRSRTVVAQRDRSGLSTAAQAATVTRAVALNRNTLEGLDRIGGALPACNTVSVPPFTRERGTTTVTFLCFLPEVGAGERLLDAGEFQDAPG
jgi:hypothetical protein